MCRTRTIFGLWFAVLALFFLIANVIGAVRPLGLKPFRSIGFPFTFAVWGIGVDEWFSLQALVLDALIAALASTFIACLCTARRGPKPPSEHPPGSPS